MMPHQNQKNSLTTTTTTGGSPGGLSPACVEAFIPIHRLDGTFKSSGNQDLCSEECPNTVGGHTTLGNNDGCCARETSTSGVGGARKDGFDHPATLTHPSPNNVVGATIGSDGFAHPASLRSTGGDFNNTVGAAPLGGANNTNSLGGANNSLRVTPIGTTPVGIVGVIPERGSYLWGSSNAVGGPKGTNIVAPVATSSSNIPQKEGDTFWDGLKAFFQSDVNLASKDTRHPTMALAVFQTEEGLIIKVDIPGVKPQDLKITLQEFTCTINARREGAPLALCTPLINEQCTSASRAFCLPKWTDTSSLKVISLEDGVLELCVRNLETAAPPPRREIPVVA